MKKREIFLSDYKLSYPVEKIADPKDILFVDIETTGFTAKGSALYLIGCVWNNGKGYVITQFMADTYESEKDVLSAFFTFSSSFKVLVHFNGNNFDIPFLKEKAKQYKMENALERLEGVDLYRRINPYKSMLKLPNCKQKTIEKFLGIHREDPYSGGDLIGVYHAYVKDHDPAKENDLFLHNRDDLLGMLAILPMLNYFDLFAGPLTVVAAQANTYTNVHGEECKELVMTAKIPSDIPTPISGSEKGCYFSAKNGEVVIKVPIVEKELKYFYSNYKDYYYLPDEDVALHKSVAGFVDKDHRIPAKASNCYTKRVSTYIPEWEPIITPFFKEDYLSKDMYFELTDEIKKNRELFSGYATHILTYIGLGQGQA